MTPRQEEDGTSTLYANCKGRGLILGRATQYQVLANATLSAWIVDTHLGTDRRVWLLSLQNDGSPLLEDISGDIARAAGKGLMAGIDGVVIDLNGFASDGTIGVHTASSGTVVQLALGQQIARERSR